MDIRTEDRKIPLISGEDPVALFRTWFADAEAGEPSNPNAMTLATVDPTGLPDARIVLLKDMDERGFTFYTNTESAKGTQVDTAGKAALLFYWKSLDRQVRVRGPVARVDDAEADAYFATRPRGSQAGAWASQQSRPLPGRDRFIDAVQDVEQRYEGTDIPRPPHWTGYRVTPLAIEFWQDRPFRLHDRLVFTRETVSAPWEQGRIYP